jgi:hypothetical protein
MALIQFLNFTSRAIGTTPVTVVSAVPSGVQYLINGFSISNTTSLPVTASAYLTRSSINVYIVSNATVNPGGSLTLAGQDQKICMMTGDTVTVVTSTSSSCDVVISAVTSTSNPGATVPAVVSPPAPSTYPSVSPANVFFAFDMNSTAGGVTNIPDVSSHAWTEAIGASHGSTGLSQVAGGPYADGGNYFYNTGAGTNSEGIATLSGIPGYASAYATYHNANLNSGSWALECNVWPISPGSYTGRTINLYQSQGTSSIQLQNQSGSTTLWQLLVFLATSSSDSGGSGITIALPNLAPALWQHLVVQAVYQSAGIWKVYAYVNGVAQNPSGTSAGLGGTWGLYSLANYGSYIGSSGGGNQGFYLDNIRLVSGAPFPITGFTPPTGVWTA